MYINFFNCFLYYFLYSFCIEDIKIQRTSVSSPLSICSRIISVYVLEPISGVLPPAIKINQL